jgi:hypothetical protein
MEPGDEGSVVSQEDLRQMQDHPSARRGARDLHESEAQAAPGVGKEHAWHASLV